MINKIALLYMSANGYATGLHKIISGVLVRAQANQTR